MVWTSTILRPKCWSKGGGDLTILSQYLETGVAPQETSFAGMQTVTHFSMSAMERNDVEAIATYLLTDKSGKIQEPSESPKPLPAAAHPEPDSDMKIGRWV